MSGPAGGPAFPSVLFTHDVTENYASHGMTLRDWFAGKALAHIIGNIEDWPDDRSEITAHAEVAYMYADAMLAERDK